MVLGAWPSGLRREASNLPIVGSNPTVLVSYTNILTYFETKTPSTRSEILSQRLHGTVYRVQCSPNELASP